MKRISSQLPTYDSNYYMRLREFDMNEMYEQDRRRRRGSRTCGTIPWPPRAPAASSRRSFATDRYGKNIETVRGTLATAEGEPAKRHGHPPARQGARGPGSQRDPGQGADGLHRRGGGPAPRGASHHRQHQGPERQLPVFRDPFRRPPRSAPPTAACPAGTGTWWSPSTTWATSGRNAAEISEGDVGRGQPARERRVLGGAAADLLHRGRHASTGCQRDQTIRIDGAEIRLSPGDTVSAIAAKINDADAPGARAARPRGQLPRARVHRPAPDLGGGHRRRDRAAGPGHPRPAAAAARRPLNVSPSARVFGGFDLRHGHRACGTRLFEGSTDKVGTAGLRGIESSITNLAGVLGDVGARDARLTTTAHRGSSTRSPSWSASSPRSTTWTWRTPSRS